jgi:hypothetical protein
VVKRKGRRERSMKMIRMRLNSQKTRRRWVLKSSVRMKRSEESMRDLLTSNGGSSLMKSIRRSSARIVRSMGIGRETARMRQRRLTAFYVAKILMTPFHVMQKHALSAIR